MARPRNPKRDEAFRLWKESNGTKALKEIAAELDVGDSQIRKWKNQDRWEDQLNGNVTIESNGNVTKRGAPKGSKNARGNKGGKAPPGNQNAKGNKGGAAPAGNKNALVTGEYESIYGDVLTEDEQALFGVVDTTPLNQVDEEIRLLSIRERRMLKRIADVTAGLSEVEKRILKERIVTKEPVVVHDEERGHPRTVVTKVPQMVVTQEEEQSYRRIDDVLKLEEALTRIQSAKQKAIKTKHEIETLYQHRRYMDLERLELDKKKANQKDNDGEPIQIHIRRKEKRGGGKE
ncbi:hypothetical protein CHH49_04055 [Terribacillus saccharophilus]|uniref:phage terminase small subunit n=1 Tax=Terribacillus saccharophilus TaxID=361277 RepID=UPI000BA78EBB|nr:phage terminase small subunit [Terribacillus saccharophilus]PAF22766.1 hypothetical protein CHH49_04055 [Terribacillus saccharophilus]